MRKYLFFLILVFFLIFPSFVSAQESGKEAKISNFTSHIEINKSAEEKGSMLLRYNGESVIDQKTTREKFVMASKIIASA